MPAESEKQSESKVRTPVAFHPPLIAIFPILAIYSANLAIIPLRDLWIPVLVVAGATFLVWGICAAIARNVNRGAAAASFICASLTLYAPTAKLFPDIESTIVWWFAILAFAAILAKLIRAAYFLNIVAVALVTVSLASIGLGELRARSDIKQVAAGQAVASSQLSGPPPDIFYIILDGYGRSDMLHRVMGFDNTAFIEGLKSRGFYVADKSHSNYIQTEISLSSSLNFDFIPNLAPQMKGSSDDRAPLDHLVNDNRASRFLRDKGYRTYAISSGFPALEFNDSDVWLDQASKTTLFETTLLQMTALAGNDRVGESQFLWRRSAILGALQNVRALADPAPRPKFVFVHLLAPHPPFVFGPNGESVPHHIPYGYWDGSDFMQYATPREYRNGYVNQTQFIDRQVLMTVDRLLQSKQRPIILIQGDHGSKMRLDQNSLAKTDVTECFQNLSAYLVPDSVRQNLYPTITPVNSFRILFSTLFNANLPKYPDRSWYSPFARPYEFSEVTHRIEVDPSKPVNETTWPTRVNMGDSDD